MFANDSENVTCAWSGEARSLAEHGYAVAVFETVGRQVRVPVLSIGSRQDPFTVFGKDTAAWHRTIPDDRALIVSGDDHGVELLTDGHGRRVRAAILAFLRSL